MISALLDCLYVESGVLHVDTFFVQCMHQVMFHGAMEEDLLSDQRLFKHGPNDFLAFTLLPVEGLGSTGEHLLPELLICGV